MVICLEQDADLHMAQLMPLGPLTVSCFSKIQIGFTFLVPAHLGSPGKRAVKRVCVCRCGQVPLFQDVPVDFMRQLCMHVVRFIFSPGEIIIYSDEPVHEIYVVHRGICQVLLLQAHLPIIDQLMGVVSERPNP